MADARRSPNWVMFWVGVLMAVGAGLAVVFTDAESSPIVIGILGIVFIGASGARLLR